MKKLGPKKTSLKPPKTSPELGPGVIFLNVTYPFFLILLFILGLTRASATAATAFGNGKLLNESKQPCDETIRNVFKKKQSNLYVKPSST